MLPSVWPHVRLRAPLRCPCGHLASALKILWPPQERPKFTVRHQIKDRMAPSCFRSPQFINTPYGYPKNKNICDWYIVWPWKYCGRRIIASGRRFWRPHGRRGKCDQGLRNEESRVEYIISKVPYHYKYFTNCFKLRASKSFTKILWQVLVPITYL